MYKIKCATFYAHHISCELRVYVGRRLGRRTRRRRRSVCAICRLNAFSLAHYLFISAHSIRISGIRCQSLCTSSIPRKKLSIMLSHTSTLPLVGNFIRRCHIEFAHLIGICVSERLCVWVFMAVLCVQNGERIKIPWNGLYVRQSTQSPWQLTRMDVCVCATATSLCHFCCLCNADRLWYIQPIRKVECDIRLLASTSMRYAIPVCLCVGWRIYDLSPMNFVFPNENVIFGVASSQIGHRECKTSGGKRARLLCHCHRCHQFNSIILYMFSVCNNDVFFVVVATFHSSFRILCAKIIHMWKIC